ncbi:MAG: HEAT repeat domain-containing protein [Candidatus Acidiferrales bacterium]
MPETPKPQTSFGGRWALGILAIALLFVLMPFLFWNATWFGRPMNDEQVSKALADHSHPRDVQHALAQLETRIETRDPSARKWYPQIIQLAGDPVDEIRVTDAWVMGQDNSSEDFHRALLQLLGDQNPMVRRNAALSLVRFKDDSGHAQIVAMLRPFELNSPFEGKLDTRLKAGDVVNPGTMVAHIVSPAGKRELRSNVPGTLDRWLAANGSSVTASQPILSLLPSEGMVWEALRALYLIGNAEDLPDVARYARGVDGMSPQIAQQALATLAAIRGRNQSN